MKSKDELNDLIEEVETLNAKLIDLTEEELEQISGGEDTTICPYCGGRLPSGYFATAHIRIHRITGIGT